MIPTRSNGCGENGLAKETVWSAERLALERLASLEVEGGGEPSEGFSMGGKAPREFLKAEDVSS